MAKIVIASQTSTSVTVYLGELDTNYSYNDRRVDWYIGYTYKAYTNIDAYAEESDTATLTGLHAGATYTIYAKVYKGSDIEPFATFSKSVTIESDTSARPSKFSWDKSIVEQGKDAIIYASDWNTLTKNINEVRAYRKANGYTVSSPTQYSFTTAVKGNALTADMFNEVLNAIKGISGYGTWFRDFEKGEDCTAQLLNSVVTELNTIP